MNRKEAILVTVVVLATFVGGTFADTISTAPTRTTLRTTSVDIEVLNVARESGIFIEPPTANFTAGFSFTPHSGFVQVTTILFTVEWNQFSSGHVGDRFSTQLNGQAPTLTAPFVRQTTQVTTLPNQDLRVGSNLLKVVVIPIDASATTNYLLYEIRLTVEYTFLG